MRRLIPYAGQENVTTPAALLNRVMPLFRSGCRTDQIARRLDLDEATVANELARQRDADRSERRSSR